MKERTTITSEQAKRVLASLGVTNIRITYSSYQLLNEDDVQVRIATAFTNILNQTGYTYIEGRRMCKQFTDWCVGWVGYWHGEQKDRSDDSVAFGRIMIPTLDHVACLVIHQSDAEVLYAVVYEPQRDGRGVSMSPIKMTEHDWRLSSCEL